MRFAPGTLFMTCGDNAWSPDRCHKALIIIAVDGSDHYLLWPDGYALHAPTVTLHACIEYGHMLLIEEITDE